MKSIIKTLHTLKQEWDVLLPSITTVSDLEHLRVTFLGRNGHITQCMKELQHISLEEKRILGPEINALKQQLQDDYQAKLHTLNTLQIKQAQEQHKNFDVTAYLPKQPQGSLHILTKVMQDLEDIFITMGYTVVEGPELETDYYNFQALNIPASHPARDHHDTFWVNDTHLLRTHTSPVQIRQMEKGQLPLAIFAPGRTFRNEATDASHDFMFTQGECLYIDKHASIGNLLATAQAFLQAFFCKKDLNIRMRPGYFPFVEPGLEIDASCPFCTNGCSTCKKTGWIELLGSGLVHPNVLRSCGIDPEQYKGFAFGFGIERLAAIKYGINDIRLFHSGKIKFLEQF